MESQSRREFSLHIPFHTVVTILLVLLFVFSLQILAPLLMTLFLSTLLAVSLGPIVDWFERKKIKRWIAVSGITVLALALTGAITILVLPKIFQELSKLFSNLPKFKQEVLAHFASTGQIHDFLDRNLSRKQLLPKASNLAPLLTAGNVALGGLTEIGLIFVFTIYLLADAGAVFRWFTAFFALETQKKIRQSSDEISEVISSYIAGQFITSAASFIYVIVALSLLHVPNALVLATLAGIFDILPVLGFFLAVIPAVLFALPVSPATALIVVALYILYHAIENYFIAPAVYGNRLRVSSFVVLVTLIAAGLLAGIEAAIAVLPVVASYPIIERIWLKKYVGEETIAEHAEMDS